MPQLMHACNLNSFRAGAYLLAVHVCSTCRPCLYPTLCYTKWWSCCRPVFFTLLPHVHWRHPTSSNMRGKCKQHAPVQVVNHMRSSSSRRGAEQQAGSCHAAPYHSTIDDATARVCSPAETRERIATFLDGGLSGEPQIDLQLPTKLHTCCCRASFPNACCRAVGRTTARVHVQQGSAACGRC